MLKSLEDYQNEIARVQDALQRTQSEYLKRDYEKYLKRLQKEMRKVVQMFRVLIKTTTDITANLEADRIEEKGEFFYLYNGTEIIGVFDIGIVQFMYKSKKN